MTYDISPYKGSEASVSWNYVFSMQHYHKLTVLYGKGKEDIEHYLQTNSMKKCDILQPFTTAYYRKQTGTPYQLQPKLHEMAEKRIPSS